MRFLLLAAVIAVGVLATSEFSQPPGPGPAGNYRDNPTYKVGEAIDIQWTSDLEYMNLWLWQDYPTPGGGTAYFKKLLENSRSTSLIWTASYDGFSTDIPKGQAGVFYLALYEARNSTFDTTCHYFNVTVPSQAISTASTTKTTPAATRRVTKSTETSQTSTATASSEPKSNSGMSTGVVAGIAVAVTIVGMIALSGVGFFVWKRFWKPKVSVGQSDTPAQQADTPNYFKAELPDDHRVELPGGSRREPEELYAPGPAGHQEAP